METISNNLNEVEKMTNTNKWPLVTKSLAKTLGAVGNSMWVGLALLG